MSTSAPPNNRRQLIAGIIVAVGLAIGATIVVLAPPDDVDPLGEYKDSKQYEANVERIGGKSAVMGAELNDFLASLFHGARLGYTVGVTSLIVAAIFLAWTRADEGRPRA